MAKHIEDLTPAELVFKQSVVQQSFHDYLKVSAEALNMCPGCIFNMVLSYAMFMAEEADKPDNDNGTEH